MWCCSWGRPRPTAPCRGPARPSGGWPCSITARRAGRNSHIFSKGIGQAAVRVREVVGQSRRWAPGDHVIFRHVWPSGVWAAIPVTVVEDSDAAVSVYVCPGTEFAAPSCPREEYLRVTASGSWGHIGYRWIGHHLWTAVPGAAWSLWVLWSDPDWTHLGWKVNPESPLKRTPLGFDTTDHVIDAVIDGDIDSWRWKDEEEFREAIDLGLITPDHGTQIRGEAAEAVEQLITKRRTDLRRLARWRPLAEWGIPKLEGNWSVL